MAATEEMDELGPDKGSLAASPPVPGTASGDEPSETPESAMSKVFSIVDYLALIGDHIHDRKSLRSLCLVNRGLNAVFSPLLYSRVTIRNQESGALLRETIGNMIASNWLGHTKLLELCDFSFPIYRIATVGQMEVWHSFQDQVIRLISHTPRLTDVIARNTFLACGTIVAIYRRCPRLREISDTANLCFPLLRPNSTPAEIARRWGFNVLPGSSSALGLHYHTRGQQCVEIPPSSLVRLGLIVTGRSRNSTSHQQTAVEGQAVDDQQTAVEDGHDS